MPETILIVDDEDSVRQTFEEWLAHCPDVVVRAAADAASALKIASQTPIDLAILDWNLGSGQNGLELLEDLHVFQPEVTAMLVTGYAHQATPLQALRMGVRDYLEKGAQLTRTTFLAAVERLLAGLRPRKRERAVQEGLARFRQTLSEMLPHVQTAAHWKNWPSMQAAAAALLGFLKEQCGAVDALLWIRVEVSAGSGAVPSDRWWNAAGEPLDPPSLDFSRTVAAATLALPRPGRVAETATLAAAGLELSPKEAAHRHVLACPLDLPADSAGIIELFDPADHGAALLVIKRALPLASLLLTAVLQEQSVQQVVWRALEEGARLSRLVDTDPPTAVDLASELRASVEALDRPEVGELTVLLRRMLERHGAPAAASCLRVLQELENLLEVATGGGA